jgi:pimeloyl-ACP methyl ester carboxylesterase
MNPAPRCSFALRLLLFVLLTSLSSGCSIAELNTAERASHGIVLILPGIEGPSTWNYNLARGLADGGVNSAIEIFDWGTKIPGGMLINLTDLERNQRMADVLRDRIVSYKREHPGRPVHIIGHSGGGGIAVMAAEKLPMDVRVTSIILLAAALSPDYDLGPALQHTQRGIFNYYSTHDRIFLDAGTRVAGTIDRSHTSAAGSVGFNKPAGNGNRGDYDKLHQIAWESEMAWSGHWGDHFGWTNPGFVRKYLAPLVEDLGKGD